MRCPNFARMVAFYGILETLDVPHPDSPSPRKLAAIALIILLILIWAGLVATLSPWVGRLPVLVQAAFYLVMGLAWIIPLRPLIRWSQTGSLQDKDR